MGGAGRTQVGWGGRPTFSFQPSTLLLIKQQQQQQQQQQLILIIIIGWDGMGWPTFNLTATTTIITNNYYFTVLYKFFKTNNN